jgi:hypothetical protein
MDLAPAVFGLVGVFVGSVLNYWMGVSSERRQTLHAARVAGRLVEEELKVLDDHLYASLEGGIYGPLIDRMEVDNEWVQARSLLAAYLVDREWKQVAHPYRQLARLRILASAADQPPTAGDPLGDDAEAYRIVQIAAQGGLIALAAFLERTKPRPSRRWLCRFRRTASTTEHDENPASSVVDESMS